MASAIPKQRSRNRQVIRERLNIVLSTSIYVMPSFPNGIQALYEIVEFNEQDTGCLFQMRIAAEVQRLIKADEVIEERAK